MVGILCQIMGRLDGIEVGVQPTLDGQDILIQHSGIGQRLACLLGYGSAKIVHLEDTPYWRIPHSPEVDRLIVELTDLFISIRYAHPCAGYLTHPSQYERCSGLS